LDDLPHFSPERDGEQSPAAVTHLRALLREADAVLICTPEYIHGMPGVLKNMLDWVVSSGEFVYKPVGIISAGPSDTGGGRAHASLTHTLEVMTAHITEDASLIIPFVRTKINADGQITDPETAEALQRLLNSLVKSVEQGPVVS
jgi:NAD(P)H-dependent FMN reductase